MTQEHNPAWVYRPGYNGDPHTVGFYTPDGEWVPESDHTTTEQAASRVNYLNGGSVSFQP